VALRCDKCGEIIYLDQPWDEYGGDYDCSDLPWHTACWEKREAERAEEDKKHHDWLRGLLARPRDSLSFEEASALTMHKTSMDLINAICADTVFPAVKSNGQEGTTSGDTETEA
jgi:hypothetical protein